MTKITKKGNVTLVEGTGHDAFVDALKARHPWLKEATDEPTAPEFGASTATAGGTIPRPKIPHWVIWDTERDEYDPRRYGGAANGYFTKLGGIPVRIAELCETDEEVIVEHRTGKLSRWPVIALFDETDEKTYIKARIAAMRANEKRRARER